MSKGDETRGAILDHALREASRIGLEGLSIGNLARDLGLSKSGLFAHFQSKEALQVQVLETAVARFLETVMAPSLRAPRGEPRIRALFERWVEWSDVCGRPGGCICGAAAAELDDQEGPAREALVRSQRDWLDALARAARLAVEAGHFRADLDEEQFAHEFYGIMLGCHHARRLLRDPKARERAAKAFEALLARARS